MKQLLAHLRTIGTPTIFRAGTNLFTQGEVPQFATIILDGVVKAYMLGHEGDEIIVNLYSKGAIVPIAWVNNQSPNAIFNYTAVNDTRVLRLSKQDFLNAIEQNPEYQREYLDFMVKNQASLLLRITGLCQSRATEKICYTLYFLAVRYGMKRENGMVEIDLKITQGLLARLIGQTRESTAKNLKLLKEEGIVDYTSSTYTVDIPKLELYLDMNSFHNLVMQ